MRRGFVHDSKTEGLLLYRKTVNGHRLTVSGYSEEECIEKMAQKEKLEGDIVLLPIKDGMYKWLYNVKITKVKPRSFDRIECTYKNQICAAEIARLRTMDVTKKDADNFVNIVYKTKAMSTVKKARDLLHGYLSYCGIEMDIELPGTREEKKLKVKQILPSDILDDQQIRDFKAIACSEAGGRYGHLFYFLICSFLRIGEALALTWRDINWKDKTIIINKAVSTIIDRDRMGQPKSKKNAKQRNTKEIVATVKSDKSNRTVYLTEEAIWALQRQKEINGDCKYIFAAQSGNMAAETNLRQSLLIILDKANIHIDGFGLHRLRHTGISYCLRHGAPVDVVANQAGHSVQMTLQVYYHIIAAQKKEYAAAMDLINKKVLEKKEDV